MFCINFFFFPFSNMELNVTYVSSKFKKTTRQQLQKMKKRSHESLEPCFFEEEHKRSKALTLATESSPYRCTLQKSIGIDSENFMLDMCEKKLNFIIHSRNEKILRLHVCGYIVSGKIDGMIEDDIVVEHKRRVRGLLGYIPFHEKVQCHFYMKMTGTTKCYLIETFGSHINKIDLYFDENIWIKIQERLGNESDFCFVNKTING